MTPAQKAALQKAQLASSEKAKARREALRAVEEPVRSTRLLTDRTEPSDSAEKCKKDQSPPSGRNLTSEGAESPHSGSQKDQYVKSTERPWRGFVLRLGSGGTSWVRVSIPAHEVDRYRVRDFESADARPTVAAKISNEIRNDSFVSGRGWESR